MRIGELAAATGATTKTLRFYEESGLRPQTERAANGYRDYGPEALSRLDFIRRGRAAGLTLAQIREVIDIRDAGDAPCRHGRDLDQVLRRQPDRRGWSNEQAPYSAFLEPG